MIVSNDVCIEVKWTRYWNSYVDDANIVVSLVAVKGCREARVPAPDRSEEMRYVWNVERVMAQCERWVRSFLWPARGNWDDETRSRILRGKG